jgi:O-acetyl-ADP-ribose deacetylase (regulator of RNase III)
MPEVRTVAFCCISTGVFGFPQEAAARVALQTVDRWLTEHPAALDRVIFNVFRSDDLAIYQSLLAGAR